MQQRWRCTPSPSCRAAFLRRSSVRRLTSKGILTRCSHYASVQRQRPGGQPGIETWREMPPTPSQAASSLDIVTLARNGLVVPWRCPVAAGPWLAAGAAVQERPLLGTPAPGASASGTARRPLGASAAHAGVGTAASGHASREVGPCKCPLLCCPRADPAHLQALNV